MSSYDDEDFANCPLYLGFLALLKGGIAAEGQSEAELEEVNEQLARTSGMTPSGDTNIWRV